MNNRNKEFGDIAINFSTNSESNASRENYIEFFGLTRVRKGTHLNEDIQLSERIINDVVAMDAGFDSSQLPNLSLGQNNLFGQFSRPKATEKYSNFHTIDWLRDLLKDKFRHRWIKTQKEKGNWLDKIQAWNDAFSGWFLVLLIGLGSGIAAGIVDIGSGWASNLKSGFCSKRFWLNREQCCWNSKNITHDKFRNPICDQWLSWSETFGIADNTAKFLTNMIVYIFFSTLFGTMAASIVKVFAPYASGSGVPEIKTILSGFVIRGFLGKWTLLVKSIGVILSSSAGLTLGKEGPFVHVASCFGNVFSYLFPKYGRNEAKKREILSAAASAGVAVAFGAPIGGVLFSLEEVSYYFPLKTLWRSFFCAMIAAFVVRTINPYGKGHDVLFYIEYFPEWSFYELIPFVILGLLGVILITLLTATLGYLNEFTRMPMPELIRHLIGKCSISDESILCDYEKNVTSANEDVIPIRQNQGVHEAIWKLSLALIFYMVMLILTFGLKIPCGLFVPCLTIGAITGRLFGILMEIISFNYKSFFIFAPGCNEKVACIIPGVYAIVGACAFLGGATRMTVSLVVIMVELTSGLSLIVPLMVSAFSAKMIGEIFCPGGIYDAHIRLNNYPYLDNKGGYELSANASDVMTPKNKGPPLTVLIQDGMTVAEVDEIVKKSKFVGFPIVVTQESQLLVGYILKRDLLMALDLYKKSELVNPNTLVKFSKTVLNRKNETSVKLEKLVEYAPLCVTDQTSMDVVVDLFKNMGISILLVTHFGKLVGVITKKDILKHLEKKKN